MRRGQDFTSAVRSGRRAGRRSLVVHCAVPGGASTGSSSAGRAAAGPGMPAAAAPPLVGFVVPRSVGTAVTRNRVQRRLRHLMRDRIGALPPGSMTVVRVQPAAAAPTAQLSADLDSALASLLHQVAP